MRTNGVFSFAASLVCRLVLAVAGLLTAARALAVVRDVAYVTSPVTGTVIVVDTTTDAVIATISIEEASTVDITPDGTLAVVGNWYTPKTQRDNLKPVAIVDTTTNTVRAMVPVDGIPDDVAVTPDGAFSYVAHKRSCDLVGCPGDGVSVIDLARGEVIGSIPLESPSWCRYEPLDVAITPDGASALVTHDKYYSRGGCRRGGAVSVIDVATNVLISTVAIGSGGRALRIVPRPDSEMAYVLVADPSLSTTVEVLDLATSRVATSIPLPTHGLGIALAPDGGVAYIAGDGLVTAIETASHQVVGTIPVGGRAIALSSDGARAYVSPYPRGVIIRVVDLTDQVPRGAIDVRGDDARCVFEGDSLCMLTDIAIARVDDGSTTPLPSRTDSPTPSATPSPSPGAPPTNTAPHTVAPTFTHTAVPGRCTGDCSGDDKVTIHELVGCVSIALGRVSRDTCSPCDASGDGRVTVDELVAAVSQAVGGCGARGT